MSETTIANISALGKLIRDRRRALRLRQADLAMFANVGMRFIVDVENGKETCQVGLLLRLLQALDIKLMVSMPTAPIPAPPETGDDEMAALDL